MLAVCPFMTASVAPPSEGDSSTGCQWFLGKSHQLTIVGTQLEKRNSFCSAQAGVGGNQCKLENFCGSGKKGVGRISVRKTNLAHGENDLDGQGRLSWRKLDKCLRDPFLEVHVQFDAALFNKDPEFPDTDR